MNKLPMVGEDLHNSRPTRHLSAVVSYHPRGERYVFQHVFQQGKSGGVVAYKQVNGCKDVRPSLSSLASCE